ncbi:MAG: hypothetical protein LQ344_007589 [Seirophora lacunosa]|nr:MAG: hypothetical protein LQ344_007589 [Seirophora lacunosa]
MPQGIYDVPRVGRPQGARGRGGRRTVCHDKAPVEIPQVANCNRDDEVVDDNDNDEEADEEADAAGDEEDDAAGDEEDDDEDDEEEEEEDEERRPLFNGESNRRLIAHGGRPYVLNAAPPVFGDDSDEERDYAKADYKVLAK